MRAKKRVAPWARTRVALSLILLSGFSISTVGTASAANKVIISDQRLDGAGGVTLDTSLYLPVSVPAPAILLAHGFAGDKSSVAAQAKSLAESGYVVLAWTARGFGKSTGEISMNSPQGEVADVSKLIDYLATRKEVVQQGVKDPLVGIAGDSYGGSIALMTAGYDNRIDAVAANITWNNLSHVLFPQNSQDPSYVPAQNFLYGP